VEKRANPACGMIIYCDTMPKRKKTANEYGAYITKLLWSCGGSPVDVGENAPELVAKRRAEIEAARVDDEEEITPPAPSPYGQPAPAAGAAPQPPAPPPPAAATPPAAAFTPPPPWIKHPTQPWGETPDTQWFWDGGAQVKNVTQLRNGA
jgi:hypothetical protein